MDSFPEVTTFKNLKQEMINYLNHGKAIFFSQNGEAVVLSNEEVSDLLFEQTPEQVLEGILSGNTRRFLGKYFTEAYLGQRSGEVDTDINIAVAA